MKDNFFNSMFSEGGKISHKRWISVLIASVLAWVIVYSSMKAINASERYSIIVATMVFIGVLTGVTTIPQIIALFRGGGIPKDDNQAFSKPTIVILPYDVLPQSGEYGVWYFVNGAYYYWDGTNFVNKGGDRPKDPPPNP